MNKQTKPENKTIFRFKVILPAEFKEDEVWRIIAISPQSTLVDFHKIIFKAFDRFDEHLWSFFMGKPFAKGTQEYLSRSFDDDFPRGTKVLASKIKLQDLPLDKRRKIYYLFDYGDEWWHDIRFLGEAEAEPGEKYPRIEEKHGESPPQYLYDEEEEEYNEEEDEE